MNREIKKNNNNKSNKNGDFIWNSLTPSEFIKRAYHSSTLFKNFIIIFGGYNGGMEALNDIIVFDILKNTWFSVTPTGDLPTGRYGHTVCNYGNDKAIVFGGLSSNNVRRDLSIMKIDDTKCNADGLISFSIEWKIIKTDPENSLHRSYHTANISENHMYVFGGWHQRHLPNLELWAFDLGNIFLF